MTKDQEMEIKRFMATEINAGTPLAGVQKKVNEKFNLKMTYMDIHILASDLEDVDWDAHDPKAQAKAKEEAKRAEEEAKKQAEAEKKAEAADAPVPGEEEAPAAGSAVVEVSKLVRPGAALSGTVKFGSGATAEWYLDTMGRLGLDNVKGGEPTQGDIAAFQTELRKEVEKLYGGAR